MNHELEIYAIYSYHVEILGFSDTTQSNSVKVENLNWSIGYIVRDPKYLNHNTIHYLLLINLISLNFNLINK